MGWTELPSTGMGEAERGAECRKDQVFQFGHVLPLAGIRTFLSILIRRPWLLGTLLPEQAGG